MTTPLVNPPVSGLTVTSDFESKSHVELRAMVEHAQPARAAEVAEKLKTAAAAIEEFGTLLQTEALSMTWEGEGGEAFRTWMADLGNATMRLGNFSRGSGEWMGHAADTLSHVHSAMPAVSTDSRTTLDAFLTCNPAQPGNRVAAPTQSDQTGGLDRGGPTQQQAYQAQQRLDADRAEAARLMRQLAGSYAWSAHQIQSLPGVTFPPMPGEWSRNFDVQRIPSGEGEAATAQTGAGTVTAASAMGTRDLSSTGGHMPAARQGYASPAHVGYEAGATLPAVSMPDQPSSSRIDSVASLPHSPTGVPDTVLAPLPGGVAPRTAPLPPIVAPPPVGARGTEAVRPGQGAAGQLGKAIAEPGGALGRVSPSQPLPSAPISRIPGGSADDIIGGRPSPRGTGQQGGALPKGTVIGTEPVPGAGKGQARGPVPHALGGVPASGSAGNRAANREGRRLASEPGGIVGGRPQQQRAQGDNRAFTPGGTGLIGDRRPKQQQGRTGRRPDYLVEDEETWASGDRRSVPPVID
ncbi:hypothetical protein ACFY2W_31175 [Streptomyces sp. NPDC001262]|uniref:WXG100 family type VII secretion target n=1 Tax=Streptomyces sp. NPDC001262 TaxID=3364552 RepID=UPI00367A82FC